LARRNGIGRAEDCQEDGDQTKEKKENDIKNSGREGGEGMKLKKPVVAKKKKLGSRGNTVPANYHEVRYPIHPTRDHTYHGPEWKKSKQV
jgi:hypothetical protein